eukprot:905138_1
MDPTIEPTHRPTIYPTIDPSQDPTEDPTVGPTLDPTIDPTTDPTNNPTLVPTTDPTKDPTYDPTDDPTDDPTAQPTKYPTKEPTIVPTISPTTAPSSPPTGSPLSFAELLNMNTNNDASSTDDIFVIGIGSIAIVILFVAFIMKRNDDQSYEVIALYLLQCFDLYSDGILAAVLYDYYLYSDTQVDMDQQQRSFIALLWLVCALSTIVPYFVNIFTSIRIINKVSRERDIPQFTKDYFDSYNNVYALFTLLSGGCYTTLALLNCKLFNLAIFNSGLSRYKLSQFEHFKIINTVILENCPQIAVQGLALYTFGSEVNGVFGATIWASFISSFLSILLSVMVWFLRRTGNNEYFRIQLDVSVAAAVAAAHTINGTVVSCITGMGTSDDYCTDVYSMRMIEKSRYRNKLGDEIANYLGIAKPNMEILSAFERQNRLRVNGIFRYNKQELRQPAALEKSAECLDFVRLLQNVYDVTDAYLDISVRINKVDDKDGAPTSDAPGIGDDMPRLDAQSLLSEWGLSQYWNVLQQHGYDDVGDWNDVIGDRTKLEEWGFKEGHISRFEKKYKQRFPKESAGEDQIELQATKVCKEIEGDVDGITIMSRVRSFSNDPEHEVQTEENKANEKDLIET